MQHVDRDARQQQTDDHAEQGRHWPSLREELGHVRTPTRPVANSCPEETTNCVRRTAHPEHIASCVPGRESEDGAQELPVATDLDQASAPPFSHTAPSTWHLVAARTVKSHLRPKPLFAAAPSSEFQEMTNALSCFVKRPASPCKPNGTVLTQRAYGK